MFTQKYMSISTRKTSVSYLALSGILLLHLLAFYPDYTKGEQVDIGSAQGFQAAWEQGGDYKLPQDWFPKHISDRQDPAELELPLKELWRFGGFSKTMPFVLGVEAYDDLVFLSYSIPDPNSDPKSARKRAKSIVACKQLRTGETVWSVADIGGRLACIPGHLLVRSRDSILVLQTETSRTVCEFPLDLNPIETDALHERNTRSHPKTP
jgi:hypothetical protein